MKIAIIGLGVMGGSFAMGLRAAGYTGVYGVDSNKATLVTAKETGIIQEGFTEANEILPEMDLILLSLYPNQIAPFVDQYREVFKKDAVITDVTGVKTTIIEQVAKVLPAMVDFVFAHPMRGSEKKGILGADHTRFIGANALITPTDANKESSLELVEKLYKDIGFSQVTRVSPELHDEQIAYVSQLMHALSVAVVNSPQSGEETMLFAGNSFQELTRIADINGDLWSELFLNNRAALLKSIECFEAELDKLKSAVEKNNEKALKSILSQAATKRRKWY